MNKRKLLLTAFVALGVLLLSVGSYGASVRPFDPRFDPATAWNGIELVFQTESGTDGKQVWKYVRDSYGKWRLEILEGKRAGDIRIFTGTEYYAYNAEADVLNITQQSGSRRLEASRVLVPELTIRIGNPADWRTIGTSRIAGFDTVEVASNDGSERVWVNPEKGIPVKYTNGVQTWTLLSAKLGQTHPTELFAPPQAKIVVRPTADRQRP